eukprot:scaffold1298_cov257-Pinguiococcus_pyrenoidosus.AAC.12
MRPNESFKRIRAGEVRDAEGRRRFHGAFTGGFSAGYFNTVGSKEGWAPKSFQSSRQKRQRVEQRPEDFMDEEDGLLGSLNTTEAYDTTEKREERAPPQEVGIAQAVEKELGVLRKDSGIGRKLLRKMGWKEGKAVGAKVAVQDDFAAQSLPYRLRKKAMRDGM